MQHARDVRTQQRSATLQRPVDRSDSESREPRRYGKPSDRSPSRYEKSPDRYFGESDSYEPHRSSGPGDYRSLPLQSSRRAKFSNKRNSVGNTFHSSESENEGSRASHVSTGSNRSVYLHATAVAEIPVQRGGEDSSERSGVQRQSRKVTRSFSVMAPWKPRHNREPPQHYDYENEDSRQAAKPPRPPRKPSEPVSRSQTLANKDSKLIDWLKKKKSREGKGI